MKGGGEGENGNMDLMMKKDSKYSTWIIGSWIMSFLSNDEVTMAEVVKCQLMSAGRSFDALNLGDLYRHFSALTRPSCIVNKWFVLYI